MKQVEIVEPFSVGALQADKLRLLQQLDEAESRLAPLVLQIQALQERRAQSDDWEIDSRRVLRKMVAALEPYEGQPGIAALLQDARSVVSRGCALAH